MIPLLAVFKRELEPIFDDFEVPTGGFISLQEGSEVRAEGGRLVVDPNECLKTIRAITARVVDGNHGYALLELESDFTTLAMSCRALDEWISKGGFLPKDWRM